MNSSPFGNVVVGPTNHLFDLLIAQMNEAVHLAGARARIALTGGSTPNAFYDWAVKHRAVPPPVTEAARWTVSDERHVPIDSESSNFGNAARRFLDPLGVDQGQRFPWPVHLAGNAAVENYAADWNEDSKATYDLCLLGMGDDTHIASLFPESPLLSDDGGADFGSIDVPDKGPRLTITPAGLARCGMIVVMVTGDAKAGAVSRVFKEPVDPVMRPAQLLSRFPEQVLWLLDSASAAKL